MVGLPFHGFACIVGADNRSVVDDPVCHTGPSMRFVVSYDRKRRTAVVQDAERRIGLDRVGNKDATRLKTCSDILITLQACCKTLIISQDAWLYPFWQSLRKHIDAANAHGRASLQRTRGTSLDLDRQRCSL